MRGVLFLIATLICSISVAQNWTLEQCIDSALTNSYVLQTQRINTTLTSINVKSAKQSAFPSLNGGATHGYNWGQTIDPFTNDFATNRVQYNNFYLNSSVVLFSGLQNYYGIKIKELDFQAAQYNRQIEIRNLKMEIAVSYMQVLLNDELLEVAKEHLKLTQTQKNNRQIYIEANQKTEKSILEIEAQEARDNYLILKAQNDLNYSLLLLQQLIGLPYDSTFNIQTEIVLVENKTNQKTYNLTNSPELQLANLNIEKKSFEIQSTKGVLYPTLSLNGSIGSGYSENSKYISPNGSLLAKPFGDQFRENLYQSVSISLNIPIFNRNLTRFQLQTKMLELQQSQLDKEQKELLVQQKTEQLRMEVTNAQAQYEAGSTALKLAEKNFEHSRVQYDNEMISYVAFLEIKNNLFKVQSEVIQGKYELNFKRLIKLIYFQQ